jgi:hypothetical protein
MTKRPDLMTLLFFIVGLLAVVDILYVQLRQQDNEDRAKAKLDCVVAVVEAARDTTGYNGIRDAATLRWVEFPDPETADALKLILANPPAPLPDCEIAWNK